MVRCTLDVLPTRAALAGLLTLAATALACGGGSRSADSTAVIRIDGSSTVFPITEAVAEEFQKATPGARVTVGISGTGGGFKKFCHGETDISDASRPIKPVEIELCRQNGVEWVELPVAYDGLAVVVHPQNTWVDFLTVAELKRLWEPAAQGRITRWNQIRPEWPDREIHLFGPGVDSGTFDYFTEAIVGQEDASRGDYTSSEDDNVLVQGVASDPNALGFFGLAYYEENAHKLKLVPIDDGDDGNGKGPILPSVETVRNGTYRPLSRPVFIYPRRAALDRPEVRAFVEFYLDHVPTLAREVGYVPLSDREYTLVRARFAARTPGSLFGSDAPAGLALEARLARAAGGATR
jgi:phosphate transport system substrate-binding protein